MRHRWLLAVLALVVGGSLGGCSWIKGYFGTDEAAEPPTPLASFEPAFKVRTLWSTRAGHGVEKQYAKLTPAVDKGRVFAADVRGRVMALDADSGRRIWDMDTRAPISGGIGVGDGELLLGTSNAQAMALSEDNGAILWRSPVSSEVLAAPRSGEGVVVVQTNDGKLFGLDASDGRRLWLYQEAVPVLTLRGRSAPLILRGKVIAGLANGKLVALTLRDGKLLWETPIAVPRGRSELDRMVDITSDPQLYEGVIYVASFQGRVAAVDPESGRILWGRDVSSYAGLAVDETNVYVTDEHSQVWALDRASGSSAWKQDKLRGRMLTAPVVLGSSVVVGDFEGYLHWLSKDNGAFQTRLRVDSSGILAPGVVAGDTLYVASRRGEVEALRAGGH